MTFDWNMFSEFTLNKLWAEITMDCVQVLIYHFKFWSSSFNLLIASGAYTIVN